MPDFKSLVLLTNFFSTAPICTESTITPNWATSNGWNLKTLMEYVGWTDVKSAMRYIDTIDPFASERFPKIDEPGRIE